MTRTFTIIAAALGLTGVALGAFGAHGLAELLEANERIGTWDLAARYHVTHAVAILGIAWASDRFGGKAFAAAGWLMTLGVVVFSGSLYVLALTDVGVWGAVTPIGGVALIAGWAALLIGAAMSKPAEIMSP